jgi:hypothetical protein
VSEMAGDGSRRWLDHGWSRRRLEMARAAERGQPGRGRGGHARAGGEASSVQLVVVAGGRRG